MSEFNQDPASQCFEASTRWWHLDNIRLEEVEPSVAYVVCQHCSINTSDYSFSYVAG